MTKRFKWTIPLKGFGVCVYITSKCLVFASKNPLANSILALWHLAFSSPLILQLPFFRLKLLRQKIRLLISDSHIFFFLCLTRTCRYLHTKRLLCLTRKLISLNFMHLAACKQNTGTCHQTAQHHTTYSTACFRDDSVIISLLTFEIARGLMSFVWSPIFNSTFLIFWLITV